MKKPTVRCVVCNASATAKFCRRHIAELEQAIAELPADLRDLQLVASRQAIGPLGLGDTRSGVQWDGPFEEGSLGDAPWDFAPGAADQLWAAGNTITTWVRHLAQSRGIAPPMPAGRWVYVRKLTITRNRAAWISMRAWAAYETQPLGPLCAWLLDKVVPISHDEAAEQIFDELTGMHAENQRWTLGRAGAEVFAGRCDATQIRFDQRPRFYVERNRMHVDPHGPLVPVAAICGTVMFGHEDEPEVRCPACGMRYKLEDRLASMREREIDDQVARAHIIADALTTLELPLGRDLLRKWIQRDSRRPAAQIGPACLECRHATCRSIRRPPIHSRGVDDGGQPVYRVGDVRHRLELVQDQRGVRLTA